MHIHVYVCECACVCVCWCRKLSCYGLRVEITEDSADWFPPSLLHVFQRSNSEHLACMACTFYLPRHFTDPCGVFKNNHWNNLEHSQVPILYKGHWACLCKPSATAPFARQLVIKARVWDESLSQTCWRCSERAGLRHARMEKEPYSGSVFKEGWSSGRERWLSCWQLSIFAEGQRFPAPTRWLTNICNSSSGGSDAVFWWIQAPTQTPHA